MANEEYRVERPLLTTRVFHGGQGRLDPASDLPSAVDPAGVYQRWRESVGSDVDDAEVELVSGLFTDEVQGPQSEIQSQENISIVICAHRKANSMRFPN